MIKQPFHLVDFSPQPILSSVAILSLTFNLISWFTLGQFNLFSIIILLIIGILQLRDIIRESKGGYHTKLVQKGIILGFGIFIITEIMLFFSFFQAFFNSSLSPGIELGAIQPPIGLTFISAYQLPLLGTCILLTSGFILTISHHAFLNGNKNLALITLLITILIGLSFTFVQFIEYSIAEFTISDSVFGSVFYMTTGLHSMHVNVGIIFLIVSLVRIFYDQFTIDHHLGLELSIYYQHFVDVIWLAVYIFYYYQSM